MIILYNSVDEDEDCWDCECEAAGQPRAERRAAAILQGDHGGNQ